MMNLYQILGKNQVDPLGVDTPVVSDFVQLGQAHICFFEEQLNRCEMLGPL